MKYRVIFQNYTPTTHCVLQVVLNAAKSIRQAVKLTAMAEANKSKMREWTPTDTNQIRLRHLRKVCIRNVWLKQETNPESIVFYYTLHITTMSAPFYTSEHQSGESIDWNDVDTRKFPESIVNSCPGVVVRVWAKQDSDSSTPELITVWAVYFNGLVYLGSQPPKEAILFANNALIFGMNWGFFTAGNSLKSQLVFPPIQEPQENSCSKSYTVASMCRIHRMQRAIYKEGTESERLKLEIQSVQSNPSRYRNKTIRSIPSLTASPADLLALQQLRAKRQVALAKVSMLQQERNRQLKSLEQLKETLKNLRVDNHTKALHLKEKHFHLQMDKDRLSELVKSLASTEEQDTRLKHQLIARRRQLFLELIEIFPIVQVKPGVYSINDVILPNSDCFVGCDDTQLSVALGHVTHLVQMLSVFLQVPNRYPVAVFSSRSRIADHVSQRDADAQKEFPLFAKGKDRLFFEYAVYLLNKDVAQLRWLCGLTTTDLAATLPNLHSLLQHLVTSCPTDEGKMKRSDSREKGFTPRSHSMASASQYMFKTAKWQPHRVSRSLAGSQMSLADPSMASTVSLDHLTDSPQAGGYFRQPPPQQQHWNNNSSSTLSLDLVVDRLTFSVSSPLLSSAGSHHHGSAPDLRSPDSEAPTSPSPPPITFKAPPAFEPAEIEKSTVSSSPITISQPLDMDDGMDSVTSRTEALAISSTFKLRGRGRTMSTSSQSNF
ncbi:UV radiation resistance-associated gene protein-like [Daphnia carinata]|uniref:UV radiation resistance-associated gene protein-like n=1 Tax=Daphnia carinata TaxID=120202 RepID=UPI00257A46AA|nr:UV radiation resistance-associated gene protein-like [Daphnia carinata]